MVSFWHPQILPATVNVPVARVHLFLSTYSLHSSRCLHFNLFSLSFRCLISTDIVHGHLDTFKWRKEKFKFNRTLEHLVLPQKPPYMPASEC